MSAEVAAVNELQRGESTCFADAKLGANHLALERALSVEHFQFEPDS